jgi:chaperonin GroES
MGGINPLGDRVLVKPIKQEQTRGGILIPDTATEKPQEGEILAVGPGRRSEETGKLMRLGLRKGDRVLYPKYSGSEIKRDGEDLLILQEKDILGVMG